MSKIKNNSSEKKISITDDSQEIKEAVSFLVTISYASAPIFGSSMGAHVKNFLENTKNFEEDSFCYQNAYELTSSVYAVVLLVLFFVMAHNYF